MLINADVWTEPLAVASGSLLATSQQRVDFVQTRKSLGASVSSRLQQNGATQSDEVRGP
jgi:hypothetical protein